jgi:hypothetical protein
MCGDIHDNLGMTIDYGADGKVLIRMEDYVESMLEEVPEDMAEWDGCDVSRNAPVQGG